MGQLTSGKLVDAGYDPVGFGTEFWKEHSIFSEAHHILQDLLYRPGVHDHTHDVKIDADHMGSLYPEVYEAWRASGGGEAFPNIARVEPLGMGGKKNGDRAAKLALAISIAKDSDHTPNVVRSYPKFGQLLDALGVTQGGTAPAGGGLPAGL